MEATVTKGDNMAAELTTASKEVFSITELLEKVLLGLPNQALLLAQQTSKTWYNTIKHSDKIQKALCLKAIGTFDNAHHKSFLASIISDDFKPPELLSAESAQEYLDGVVPNRYHINPMIERFLEVAELDHEHFSYCTTQYQYKELAPTLITKCSAGDMFLTQPPATTIQFQCCQDLKHWDAPCVVNNPAGITILDVVARIEARRGTLERVGHTGLTYILDFIVPVKQNPFLYNAAMQQVMKEYCRMIQAGEDVENEGDDEQEAGEVQ